VEASVNDADARFEVVDVDGRRIDEVFMEHKGSCSGSREGSGTGGLAQGRPFDSSPVS
jgi:hypothetical protein